jgi:hypothetical protein
MRFILTNIYFTLTNICLALQVYGLSHSGVARTADDFQRPCNGHVARIRGYGAGARVRGARGAVKQSTWVT